jgi:apolipoprotein N-acyltransferase
VRLGQVEALDAASPKLKVAVVQANVGAASKHEHAAQGIARYRSMTDEAMRIPGVGLVVWPESGLNHSIYDMDVNLSRVVSDQGVKAPMIVGALRGELTGGGRRVWNTAFSLDDTGKISGHYDKIVRLVFGEYVPGDTIFPFIYDLLPYSGHFEAGQSLEPLPVGPYRVSVDICYEDILPSLLRRLMGPIDAAGNRPQALVNVTNDSWYGPSEPPIHLALAVFRAAEHRRWMVRSTATGISAFIDSAGRPVQRSQFETEQLLVQDVPMITSGPTVYGRLGDWPGYLGVAFVVVVFVRARRQRRKPEAQPARAQAA